MSGEKKSRLQSLTPGGELLIPKPGPALPLVSTSIYVKSVIIQAKPSNTDYVYVGDSSGQYHAIEPARSIVIYGDALDNGTDAQLDLSTVYVNSNVNNEGVSFMYMLGA